MTKKHALAASFVLSLSLSVFLSGCPLSQTTNTSSPTSTAGLQKETSPAAAEGKLITTPSGLQYKDLVIGKGATPQQGQKVVVHYTGKLKDGTKFDSSRDRNRPFEFTLGVGQVIKGWDEGLSTMRVGGRRLLMIPPDLGYGARGVGNIIPPNAELHFDVELFDVK